MADMPDMSGFATALLQGPNFVNPAYATPQQRAQMYAYGDALLKPTEVKNGWQGIAEMTRAIMGGYAQYRADQMEQASQAQNKNDFAGTVGSVVAPGTSSYVPGAQPSQTGSMTPSLSAAPFPSTSSSAGADIAPLAASYYLANGITNPLGAAALAGNTQAESGFNPGASRAHDGHDGSAAINIGQWNGSRAVDFNNFVAQNKLDPNDPKTGLAFQAAELNSTEKNARDALNAARTPEEANAAALSYFRPAGYTAVDPTKSLNYATRLANTQAILGRLAPPAVATNGAPPAAMAYAGPQAPVGGALSVAAVNGAAPQGNVPVPPPQPVQMAGGALPVSAGAIGELLGNTNISDAQKAMAMGLLAPKTLQDATGNIYQSYQNRPVNQGAPIFQGGTRGADIEGLPQIITGSPTAPRSAIVAPNVAGAGGSSGSGLASIIKKGSPLGDYLDQKRANAADATAQMNDAGNTVNQLNDYRRDGIRAKGTLGQLDAIDQQGQKAGYGVIPNIKEVLGRYGVETDGLSDIDAYNRAIDAFAPNSPIAGQFKSALGGMLTTPQGRQAAVANMKLLAQYQQQVGAIAGDEKNYPSYKDRMTAIQALPPPRLILPGAQTQGNANASQGATANMPDVLSRAKAAIAAGAPRDKVIERLKANGYDASGF